MPHVAVVGTFCTHRHCTERVPIKIRISIRCVCVCVRCLFHIAQTSVPTNQHRHMAAAGNSCTNLKTDFQTQRPAANKAICGSNSQFFSSLLGTYHLGCWKLTPRYADAIMLAYDVGTLCIGPILVRGWCKGVSSMISQDWIKQIDCKLVSVQGNLAWYVTVTDGQASEHMIPHHSGVASPTGAK